MKILQVSHGLPPKENAGVELYTVYLSKALAQLDHQVHLFCRGEDPEKDEFSSFEEEVGGLGVTRAVNNFTRIDGPRTLYDNSFFDQIFLQILKQEKPDIVHFQHIFGLSGHLVQIAKREGLPVVFTLHDYFTLCTRIQLLKKDLRLCKGPLYGLECLPCYESLTPQDIRTKLFLWAKDFLPFSWIKWTKRFFIPPKYLGNKGYEAFHRYRYMYEVFKACDLLLTPSQYVKNFFLAYYSSMASKMKALSLGIPSFKHQGHPRKQDQRVRFCYIGNILPMKGIHILVDAFKTLPQGKAILTVYGARTPWTQDYYDRLKKQASGLEVDFRGPYQREDLPEALSDQDVVVLPAIWPETFSIVIREATLLGLPVIASRIGAIPEAIQDGVNGFLFEPRDREDLRRTMLRFIENPQLLQEMALKMQKPKSMAEHAQEMVELYNKMMRKKR